MRLWSYNRHILPELPEQYSHCFIVRAQEENIYWLRYANVPFEVWNGSDGVARIGVPASEPIYRRGYIFAQPKGEPIMTQWGVEFVATSDPDQYEHHGYKVDETNIIWTSEDIKFHDDGTTYMKASEEPKMVACMTSFQLGVAVGLGLKGLPGKDDADG